MRLPKLSDFDPASRRTIKRNLTTLAPGHRVAYCGARDVHRGKLATVQRIIKSRLEAQIRFDDGLVYRATLHNVTPA